jgi:transmembrane sensor
MERPETKLAEFGAAIREALSSECHDSAEIRTARAGFLQHVAGRNARAAQGWTHRWRTRRWPLLLLAGAGAATAALFGVWSWSQLPVSFEVGPTAVAGRPGDLVVASPPQPTPLRFSEGSSLLLHEGGRLRVLATEAKGARVLVEEGTLDVSIVPARVGKKRWNFEAGPFSVRVTGTRFSLSYHPIDQSLGLAMREGQVVVSGPCLKRPTPVSAGGRVDFSCEPPPPTAVKTVALSGPPPAPPSPPAIAPAPARPTRDTAWRELLAAGRLQDALRAAEQANFGRVCQVASSKELLALADGARLFGRASRAVAALRVLRQRFPRSAEAPTAAFTLGRIAFEQKHAYSEAATWFSTYLRERPGGPLMGDSFGRLMEARLRAGDQAGARANAEQYLRRFPEGPYASEARGILSK